VAVAIVSGMANCRRFGDLTRADAKALGCQIDLAQEPHQAKKETQHRRNE